MGAHFILKEKEIPLERLSKVSVAVGKFHGRTRPENSPIGSLSDAFYCRLLLCIIRQETKISEARLCVLSVPSSLDPWACQGFCMLHEDNTLPS